MFEISTHRISARGDRSWPYSWLDAVGAKAERISRPHRIVTNLSIPSRPPPPPPGRNYDPLGDLCTTGCSASQGQHVRHLPKTSSTQWKCRQSVHFEDGAKAAPHHRYASVTRRDRPAARCHEER